MSMKIGIYAGKQKGGGHTYVSEVLLALSDLAEESHHTFTLLTFPDESFERIRPYINSTQIEISYMQKDSPTKAREKGIVQRMVGAIQSRIRKALGVPNPVEASENPIERAARQQGIQIIWFLDQVYRTIPDIPYIATLWDLLHRSRPYFPEVEEDGIWEFRETGLSRYLQRAAIVIAGSQTGKAEIKRFYQVPSERIQVLPFPTPQFALNSSLMDDRNVMQKYGLSGEYIFYPAQFWAHKNHANLLFALDVLREKYQVDFHMVFVGSDRGNDAYIRQIISDLNLSSQVHVLGFVPQSDIIALYRNAFALTFMTFNGPGGIPPLEAFALGCPVVASNVSGAEELYGNAALLVDPKNPEEIAQAIHSLQRDPHTRAILIDKGRERASSWTSHDLVRGVFAMLDEFEPIRRCWA